MTEFFDLNITLGSFVQLAEITSLADSGSIHYPELLLDSSWLHILLMLILVGVNGFFVANEVALIKLRVSQLNRPDPKYAEYAEITRKILDNLERYINACKLGASISGVLLGAVSVPFFVNKFAPIHKTDYLIKKFGFQSQSVDLAVAFVLAVCVVIAFLVVLGKVIPNSIGFRREVEVSMRCSRPLYYFYHVFALPIIALTRFTNWFMANVLKIEPASEREIDHTAEDLKIFVEETAEGAVTDTERDILINTLELNDLKVLDIITPRSEVVALDVNLPFEKNLEVAVRSKHTRFPLIDEHLDDSLGWVHIKDLIELTKEAEPDLEDVRRTILSVSEDMKLDLLLTTLLSKKANIALVNDEFGGIQGIVMRDQILRLLVEGAVDGGSEEGSGEFEQIGEGEFLVAANMALHELDDKIPELDLESENVRTVGGYVTSVFGKLPDKGDVAEIEGFQVEVTEVDERKILGLKFVRLGDHSEKGSD